MSLVSCFILFVTFVFENDASNILAVFPTPSISHQVVFRPLILEIVKRGHEVTMVTTDPIFKKGHAPKNLFEIDMHDLSYKTYNEYMKHGEITTGKKSDLQKQMSVIYNMMLMVFKRQLLTDEMQDIIKDTSRKFDLLILEAYVTPLLALTHIYKNTPVILVSSFGSFTGNLKTVGASMHPFIYPTCIQQRIYKLSLSDKLMELYNRFNAESIMSSMEDRANIVLKEIFGKELPDFSELKDNVDMLFLNVHPIWEMNRPVPPSVIYMGGLHQKPENELPKDLKQYLNTSKNGIIYISFGTNVEPGSLPPEKIKVMIDTFSKLPLDILWKWNQDTLPGQTDNIKISKWLPQSDLLKHPKVKLFITQGGLQSTDEAISAGVPLIGIPMLGDQWFNVQQYLVHKIGLQVDMDTITEETLGDAITTILEDKSYRDNILKLRDLMRDQPQTPLERAIWWTEHVLRHGGGKHLRSPAANMPWSEYLELELVSFLVFCLLLTVACVCLVVYYFYCLFIKEYESPKLKKS